MLLVNKALVCLDDSKSLFSGGICFADSGKLFWWIPMKGNTVFCGLCITV